ncbi:MAG TPA: SH3 domain-containing protein, partial [Leptolinea sp.]
MKHIVFLLPLSFILFGCAATQPVKPTPAVQTSITEIACQGVEPKGLTVGLQAYINITGPVMSVNLYKAADNSAEKTGSLVHHMRVQLEDGPTCAASSAWWKVSTLDGEKGWVQIGPDLEADTQKYAVVLEPFKKDAVQRDVPDNRKKEAQVRYILADIELGGADVKKYYQDQVAAKPDDPETESMRAALDIWNEWGRSQILANSAAFERKPLRGGTSVVDAGTEFVQPGLDI